MFSSVLFMFFSFPAIFCTAESSPTINVTPANITLGFTKKVSIECTSRKGPSSSILNLMAIAITYTKDKTEPTVLASITAFEGLTTNKDLENKLFTSGLINNTGLSYVNIIITNPQKAYAGLYTCEFSGFARKGKLTTLSVSKQVFVDLPSIELAMQEIENINKYSNDMKHTIASLKAEFNKLVLVISELENSQRQWQAKVELLQNKSQLDSNNINKLVDKFDRFEQLENETIKAVKTQKDMVNNLIASKSEYFYASNYFNERRYWLTREATFFSVTFARSVCGFLGGYLAEIDTHAEFNFVRSFVMLRGSTFESLVVGGTDEGHEGHWVNQHSKTAVASFWAPGEPNNGGVHVNQNCQSFFKFFNWYMDDLKCLIMNSNSTGFICEIPE